MRGLTEAEARVIAVLMGSAPTQERERLRRLKIPRSTYHAARRRAYDEGWLRDRYMPDPARFGWPRVTFLLARPYLDKAAQLMQRWADLPEIVHLWGSAQVVLGVLFHSTDSSARKRVERLTSEGLASWTYPLIADVTGPGVPVYFDYEGLWTHLTEFEGTVSYPLGLGGGVGGDAAEDGRASISDHQRWAAGELVHRPFVSAEQGRPGHLVGPFGLPFSQQKLLRYGWVVHRVLLEASHLPAYKGRQTAQVVFITGTLRSGVEPQQLFAVLTRESRVFPFLYVVRENHLLLAALGGTPSPTSAPTENLGARRPVMRTLQEALEGIEIAQESSLQLTTPVDHRYDRLLARRTVT